MSTPPRDSPPVEGIGDGIVGRQRELVALQAWLDAARAGAGRLVLCAGEPGIGKTRLAQEFAGVALAGGTPVAWGRCVEAEGAPAFWPWRQVLRSLGFAPDAVLAGDVESPEDRFRLFDDVTEAVRAAAVERGLVVILDDIHWGDTPSLLVLRHLADQIAATRVLVLATFRDVEPASVLPRLLPDLLRAPAVARLDLRGFDLAEVHEQLSRTVGESPGDARAVLDVTGGNPLFVREVTRAMADGTWRADRPPRTVLDVVRARLDRVSAACRRMVQAAAIVGRDFSLPIVAATLGEAVGPCLPLIDEAIAYGLVDRVGDVGDYRFVHALTREAVEASLTTASRTALHRAVAEATEARFADDLSEHLADIARHWAELAPYGEAATARAWAIRAAEDAVGRLAHEEGVRFYRAALALPATSVPDAEQCRVLVALGRAAYLAGDLQGCLEAAVSAAAAAAAADSPTHLAEAALVVEAAPDPRINAVAKQLCEQALTALGDAGHGDIDHGALRARQEACPGPDGRAERLRLATEMLDLAQRTNSARAAMWGRLWRIQALVESGQLAHAAAELPGLQLAVERAGGPVSAWHLDRVTACVAQAHGRYADAAAIGRRAFERMRAVEAAPAAGAWFGLQSALAGHVGVTDEAAGFAQRPFDPPPRFATVARLSRAVILLCAGLPDEAGTSYQQAGPLENWSLPAFFILPGYVYGALAAAGLGRVDDLAVLLAKLEPFRGEHVAGEGVAYMGPVELTLGRVAAALGRLDSAVHDLADAAVRADGAGAPGFVAEARYHLAVALVARDSPGDGDRARVAARDADRMARALGMAAYIDRTTALVARLDGPAPPAVLSPREAEIAALVAEGLTNRQIAERLVISERTAQNHVQHILTKLSFATRSQIAAWSVRQE